MGKLELLKIANNILKSNNYKKEFEIISDVSQEVIDKLDLYYMGGIPDTNHGLGVYYTMAIIPKNFVKFEGKFYQLF